MCKVKTGKDTLLARILSFSKGRTEIWVSLNDQGKINLLNAFIMKKLSLENLKLEANDMLQRSQLKTVFGGYNGGTGAQCRCKNRHTGAEWFGDVDDCEECGNWCANNVPQGQTYTSWICTGPIV